MSYRISQLILIAILMFSLTVIISGQTKGYSIQIAAVENQSEALARIEEMKNKGIDSYLVQTRIEGRGTMYRIRIGRFKTSAEARTAAEKYRSSGLINDFFIATYEPPSDSRPVRPAATVAEKEPGKKAETAEKGSRKVAAPEPAPAAPVDPEPPLPKAERPAVSEPPPRMAGLPGAPPDVEIKAAGWKAYALPEMIRNNLRSIHFVDALTGWLVGDEGSVYRTTDGGMSWKPQSSGTRADLKMIRFIDWNCGWIVGDSEPPGPASEQTNLGNVILLTGDGGNSWRKKSLPFVTGLFFIDKNTGWAVGRNATLLKTVDGGEEWEAATEIEQIIGLPVESTTYKFGFSDIFFLDRENGWVIGNFYGQDRNNIGGLFVTSNGGRNWNRIPLTLDTRYSSGRFTPGQLHSVRFSDSKNGIVSGEMTDGEGHFFFVLHTSDGGQTWEQHRTPSYSTLCTTFFDLQSGWMASFNPLDGAPDGSPFETIFLKTDNGGLSWQKEFFVHGRRIRDIHFISPRLGWAVGDRGLIMKYEIRK